MTAPELLPLPKVVFHTPRHQNPIHKVSQGCVSHTHANGFKLPKQSWAYRLYLCRARVISVSNRIQRTSNTSANDPLPALCNFSAACSATRMASKRRS